MNIMKQQGTTLVQRACANVKGFNALHKKLEKNIIVSGQSMSTLSNYMRCIAHVALRYKCLPSELDLEQIEDYLLELKKKGASEADFKLTESFPPSSPALHCSWWWPDAIEQVEACSQ